MELKEKLKEILASEFGITTDEQLMAAVSQIDLDLGIFTAPIEERRPPCKNAS